MLVLAAAILHNLPVDATLISDGKKTISSTTAELKVCYLFGGLETY
jgi:hypothetical protein